MYNPFKKKIKESKQNVDCKCVVFSAADADRVALENIQIGINQSDQDLELVKDKIKESCLMGAFSTKIDIYDLLSFTKGNCNEEDRTRNILEWLMANDYNNIRLDGIFLTFSWGSIFDLPEEIGTAYKEGLKYRI